MHLKLVQLPLVKNIQTEDWGWMSIAEILSTMPSCEAWDLSAWEEHLRWKRSDDGYPHLVESIKNDGLFWPVQIGHGTLRGRFGNGHHRLAACIDLGYTHIPVTRNRTQCGWDDDNECSNEGLTPECWKENYLDPC